LPITTLPPAPSISDPATFEARADALLEALDDFVTEANELETNVNAKEVLAVTAATTATAAAAAAISVSDYASVTTALLNFALGVQGFTMGAGLAFDPTLTPQVVLILLSDDRVRMTGNITAYNSVTGVTSVTFTRLRGTAVTGTGWAVLLKAFEGMSPEDVEEVAAAYASIF
jgi:hypothetical protein